MNHLSSNTFTPEWFVTEVQSLIQHFLWDGKPPKIKNTVITNTIEKGGLQFPNIDLIIRTQKLAWVRRMIENPNAAWMQLLYTILPAIDINSIFKCTIDPQLLGDTIPNFYSQILHGWFELHPLPKSSLDIRREMIWYNKYITINDKPFFKPNLFRNGVHNLNNLINKDGKIYKYHDFINRYNVNINEFEYMKLIDAIPQDWRKKMQNCAFSTNMVKNNEKPHIKINNIDKHILQISSKEIYLKLLKNIETEPSCINAWNQRLQLTVPIKDWQYIFTLAKSTISDTKVIELQYKIIHRCYATDSIIAKWDNTKSEHCDKCQSKANILHNFALCPDVKAFWESLRTKSDAIKITTPNALTTQDIIFGKYKEAKYDHFNHLCMYAKYYIHRQYIAKKDLNISNFITYYSFILSVERQKYTEKNQSHIFKQRFAKCSICQR